MTQAFALCTYNRKFASGKERKNRNTDIRGNHEFPGYIDRVLQRSRYDSGVWGVSLVSAVHSVLRGEPGEDQSGGGEEGAVAKCQSSQFAAALAQKQPFPSGMADSSFSSASHTRYIQWGPIN